METFVAPQLHVANAHGQFGNMEPAASSFIVVALAKQPSDLDSQALIALPVGGRPLVIGH